MSTLKIDISGPHAQLAGFLDENSDLKPLLAVQGPLSIAFKDLSRVNSCGVRDWVNLIVQLSGPLTYEECPMVVVKQLNAVPDFQGKAKVTSFYAPYFCENCDEESMRLLKSSDVVGGGAPAQTCAKCAKPLNFDAIADQYFSFLKR